MNLVKTIVSSIALIAAANAFADSSLQEATYTLTDGIVDTLNPNSSNGTLITLIDGREVYVGLTAWSDTGYRTANKDRWDKDNLVVRQTNGLTKYGSGFGFKNNDRYRNSDSYGDRHTIDNYRDEKGKQDFDMVLLSFDTEVKLANASMSYVDRYNSSNSGKDITVAGLNDITLFQNNATFSWKKLVREGIVSNASLGHYAVTNKISTFSTNLQAAKYWLVGAYNTAFDPNKQQTADFGFKLSSIKFTVKGQDKPSTEVSEPGMLALMGLGLGMLAWRRKRSV